MELARRIIRDPLAHFLLAGGLLFAAFALSGGGDSRGADETTIVVDEAALVQYMQYRSQAFEPGYFASAFEAMSPEERQQLVDAYVREEAMTREARAMGLDDVDYVIRQRLIQKMLFIADGTDDAPPPTEEDLRAHFRDNAESYRSPGAVSFTHVFIDDEAAHPGGGEAEARRVKSRLAAARAGFNDAPQYGDRFPYLQNYLDRSGEFVANQFGAGFAAALQRLEPSTSWQGPLRSQFGWHVVLLTAKQDAGLPDFAEIRDQVEGDYLAERNAAVRQKSIDELLSQYEVELVGLPGVTVPGAGE